MNSESIYHFLKHRQLPTGETGADIKAITEKYPWFAGGHLLNALYAQQTAAEDAEKQIAKAQIFLSNPLWMNWQLSSEKKEEVPEPIQQPPTPAAEETELSFEPLHTIDYFASQGIRLKQEQLGNDKFSQQVKTFTHWLQAMKKIYHTDTVSTPKNEDGNISLMAAASNEQEEILTETMAEVLIHQGKPLQAIHILEKLSLLHPEKSSYFAARISNLKNRN